MFCPKCNKEIHDSAFICEYCGHVLKQPDAQQITYQQSASPAATMVAAPQKRENILAGIVGAIVGAAIGAASIVLLGQLNMVAAISGVLLAVCTLKGYELLGGKLSTVGIIVSVLLLLVTPYLADRLDWAILIMNELDGVTLGEAFQSVHELEEMGFLQNYYSNLGMLYLFVLLGAGSIVINAIKGNR